MLQRRAKLKMGVKQPSVIRSPGHMKWVRSSWACCIFDKHECDGRNHAHHCREGANGGTGMKPDDSTVVPLCERAHEEIHRIGWKSFESKYRIDLSKEAQELWNKSPHRLTWERKCL